jgi:hypothetical protein
MTHEAEDNAILKIPERLTPQQKLQAQIDAAGLSGKFKIAGVRPGNTAGEMEVEVQATLTGPEAENLLKLLTIKLFTPEKDSQTLLGREVKDWSVEEIKKRSRTKGDGTPSLPD